MTITSSEELTLLHTRPQSTKLWLSIYQPRVVMACQVNDPSIAKGSMTITYDGVTTGSYSNVEPDMVMLVGSSPNNDDYGRVRVRYATSSYFSVEENDHVDWKDNLYLTVLNFFEIKAVFPRIVQNENPETVTFYKDYDIEYTNQNTILGSFVCMGPHHAAFRDGDGLARVFYSASGTYDLKGRALTYAWTFEGGNPSSSSDHTPGWVTYNTPGHYTTKLVVSSDDGSSDTSYRHISIYDRPENGTNVPILNWGMSDLYGDRDSGGYTAKIVIRQDVPSNIIRDGALVVIFADDFYGETDHSVGGNAINRSSIFFVGYIISGTISYDYDDSSIEFEVGSPIEIMKITNGFAIETHSSADPSAEYAAHPDLIPSPWILVLDQDCRRALYHYLRWHSTVLKCTDFEFIGQDRRIHYFTSNRESLYDAVQTLMRGTLVGDIVCDRQGKIFAEIDMSAVHNATGSFNTCMEISSYDWRNTPVITERQYKELSYFEAGGIAYDGPLATNTDTPLLACAPGNAPAYWGGMETIKGLALESQDQLNILVGDIFANRNVRYPNINYQLAGNYRTIDIAPQEMLSITMMPEENRRRVRFDKKPFAIRRVTWQYDPDMGILLANVDVKEITSGIPGDTITIPVEPPDNTWQPPIVDGGLPPVPPVPPPVPPPPEPSKEDPALAFAVGVKFIGTGTSDRENVNSYDYVLAKTSNFNTTGTVNWHNVLPSSVSGIFEEFHVRYEGGGILRGFYLTNFGLWELTGLEAASPSGTLTATQILSCQQAWELAGQTGTAPTSGDFIFNRVMPSYVGTSVYVLAVKNNGAMLYIYSKHVNGVGSWNFASLSGRGNESDASWVGQHRTYSRGIAVGLVHPDYVWVSPKNGNIWKSEDGGVTFFHVFSGSYAWIQPETIYRAETDIYMIPGTNDLGLVSMGGRNSVSNLDGYILKTNGGFGNFGDGMYSYITYNGIKRGGGDRSNINSVNMVTSLWNGGSFGIGLFQRNWDWPGASGHEPAILFVTNDLGSLTPTWTFRHQFSGTVRKVTVHKYDSTKVYISGNDRSFSNSSPGSGTFNRDGFFLASMDGGYTFTDRVGDWWQKFGTFPAWHSSIVNDLPCYVYPIFL